MRCPRLRDFNGFVHFVPNGEMKIVTNRSRGWARAGVELLHYTGYQWEEGPHVPLNELQRGDLLFYATDTGAPSVRIAASAAMTARKLSPLNRKAAPVP